ncbi:MAG: winged helix-turn-helix domain-containing protein [Reyranella sp.]|nr:winged helix-turn-helix domain-containing protein [Reyranella sp.]
MSWSSFEVGEGGGRLRRDCPSPLASGFSFRRFRVFPSRRQLFLGDREVAIGSRAFDLLVVLLKARGTVVDKARIFELVWPSTTVDESNLRFQIGELRSVLGADRDAIKTVPRRGYMMLEEWPTREPTASMAALSDDDNPPYEPQASAGDRPLGDDSSLAPAQRAMSDSSYPAMPTWALLRIRALERENARLRRAVADLADGRLPCSLDSARDD